MSENERRAAAYSRRCGRKRKQLRRAYIQRAAVVVVLLAAPLLVGWCRG